MSIQGLAHARTSPADRRRPSASATAGTGGASFQERLSRTASAAVTGPGIQLRMPGENTVYSGWRNGGSVYAEYTADSTPEDPVVRVTGTADSGPYDFTCHVNEIDPSNASYAELAALYGHLVKTGQAGDGVLPTGLESGDVTVRRDYLGAIARHQYDCHYGNVCRAQASELLALYSPHASGTAAPLDRTALLRQDPLAGLDEARLLLLQRTKEGREWKKEQEEWDRLMKGLDSWIDALRERSERERKEGGGVTAEGGGVTAEGGEALLALYRGYIAAAVEAEASGTEPSLSREDLLSALTSAQAELLERLKEEKASEEEREEWADLLRRLDTWIETLRDVEDPERVPRTEGSAVAGDRESKYEL